MSAARYFNGRNRVYFYTKPKYGHYLFRHLRAFAQYPQIYHPPPYFDAMKASPPPPGPFRVPHRGRITFPGEKYYAQIERKSAFIRKLNRIGVNPIPWWFTRRPAEEAVARVQELMEKNNWSLNKAVFEFDKEYASKQKVKEIELELLREQAAQQGAYITPLDVFRVLQVIRDVKVKSDEIYNYKLRSGRRGVKPKPMKIPPPLFNKEELEKLNQNIHRKLHPSLLRKLQQVFELKNLSEKIEYIKYRFGTDQVEKLRPGTPLQTKHYLSHYVRAMDIEKIPSYAPERRKELRMYYGTIAGLPVHQYLDFEYGFWKEGFQRFARMVEIKLSVPKVLSKIDLGFDQENNPFSAYEDLSDIYFKLGIDRTSLTGELLKYADLSGFEQMKADQAKLEEFLDLVKLCEYIRPEVFSAMSNKFAYNFPSKNEREAYEKWMKEEPERLKAFNEDQRDKAAFWQQVGGGASDDTSTDVYNPDIDDEDALNIESLFDDASQEDEFDDLDEYDALDDADLDFEEDDESPVQDKK